MSAAGEPRDPFALTADTQGYIPRDATDEAIEVLDATLREGKRPAALVGPPGLGKTLVLHLLAQRLGDRLRPVYLPYAALVLDELCAWALAQLGFSQSDDTIGDLIETATNLHARGSALLLLVDDASAMPLPTARKLGDLVAASRGALRLLVAAAEGPSASRMLAATGANVHVVRLVAPMSEEETRRYVLARLARAGVEPAAAARFDEATLRSIHRLSAGIPRRVHSVASAVLRGAAPESGADRLEDGEAASEAEAAAGDALRAGEAPGEGEGAREGRPESRAAEIAPAFEALRDFVAPRPLTRVEAPPSARALFASVLLFGALCVAVPWLRSQVAPLPASVAAPRRAEPARRAAPRPAPEPAPGQGAEAQPPPAAATLSVQVNARPWANIEVDGVDLGPTPLAGIPLLAGRHHFRARMPDGRVLDREVEVSPENRFIVFE